MIGLRQMLAASSVALASLRYRAAMSLSTILGVALVSMVLVSFLAMAAGLQRTLSSTGSADVAIIFSKGAKAEATSTIAPADARLLQEQLNGLGLGKLLSSAETVTIVPAQSRDDETIGLVLRGIGDAALSVRKNIALVSGRMFRPGTNEIIVGSRAQASFGGLDVGRPVRLGAREWLVVGVFEARNSAFGSEAWGDAAIVRAGSGPGVGVSSIRVQAEREGAMPAIERLVESMPRLDLDVVSEQQFFARQAEGLVDFIKGFGWPIAIVMATGALVGALNTMFSSVEERARDIATLRAIGFSRRSSFFATFVESVCLAMLGAAAGIGMAVLLLDGFMATTLTGGMSQLGFALDVDGGVMARAFLLAVTVGALGGLLPAWRGARQPILRGLEGGDHV